MAAINLTNVTVLNNNVSFLSPFLFEISYECLYDLQEDLEWKLIYVGSSDDSAYDQVLETIYLGPVTMGSYSFQLQADAPDPSKIPQDELVGVTAILLTCSYRGQEFIRVGYFVNVDFATEGERDQLGQPGFVPVPARLVRSILADKPRVTRFPVDFDQAQAQETGMGLGAEMGVLPGQDGIMTGMGGGGAAAPPPPRDYLDEEEGMQGMEGGVAHHAMA